MKISYVPQRFNSSSKKIINSANEIIEEYSAQGYSLTLRQLYYQFVSRDLIANKQKEYKRIGSVINNARLAGLVDWKSIVDRTRSLRALPHWDHPRDIVETCSHQFRLDKWEGQEYRVEVWIEKDALVGVIEEICNRWDVPYFSCRGYTSQSEMWNASQRHLEYENQNQKVQILHLGDHDPSGMDMSRDIQDRLTTFDTSTTVHRIALNMDQVDEFNPPPNPTKLTDSRSRPYMDEFGSSSWELDALEPKMITKLIEKYILRSLDRELFLEVKSQENTHRDTLSDIALDMD